MANSIVTNWEMRNNHPECYDGKCDAPANATGITNCIHCGGELREINGFWYHHSQFDGEKLISPENWQDYVE